MQVPDFTSCFKRIVNKYLNKKKDNIHMVLRTETPGITYARCLIKANDDQCTKQVPQTIVFNKLRIGSIILFASP